MATDQATATNATSSETNQPLKRNERPSAPAACSEQNKAAFNQAVATVSQVKNNSKPAVGVDQFYPLGPLRAWELGPVSTFSFANKTTSSTNATKLQPENRQLNLQTSSSKSASQALAIIPPQAHQDFKCAVCCDWYNNPMMLTNCGHSFCCLCLQQCAGVSKKIVCPLCRTETIFPEGGVKALKTNIALQNLVVREKSRYVATDSKLPPSSYCRHAFLMEERVDTYSLCRHCMERFCSDCRIVHMDQLKSEILKVKKTLKQLIPTLIEGIDDKLRAIDEAIGENLKTIEEDAAVTTSGIERSLKQLAEQSKQMAVEKAKELALKEASLLKETASIAKDPPASISDSAIQELMETPLFECSLESVALLHEAVNCHHQQIQKLESLDIDSYREKIRLTKYVTLEVKSNPVRLELHLGRVHVGDANSSVAHPGYHLPSECFPGQ